MKDIKPVYQVVSKEQGEVELDNLELNRVKQYPLAILRDKRYKLSAYFHILTLSGNRFSSLTRWRNTTARLAS